ncbi:MAG: matrixin family metalloprotease [Phycisphaeraceae bacterium]|nr:MAG: matrixin family metalloprotease [Phycisphaeraceae bacterium]
MRTSHSLIFTSIALCVVLGLASAQSGGTSGSGDDTPTFYGDGWDGPGQNATTVYFHFVNALDYRGREQREAMIAVLEDWAGVVQIHFVETPIAHANRCIEFLFASGDHCDVEPVECGAPPECVFNGNELGRTGHAAYPPGIPTVCDGISQEPYAGDVHLDADESYRIYNNQNGYSLWLVTAHNVGHALGLADGVGYIMDPNITWGSFYVPPVGSDAAQILHGYAAGEGSVTRLEDSGIWVNNTWQGAELGTPGNPFNSLAHGVGGVPPFGEDVPIHVLGGLYPENITITKPCMITAEFGTAYIGQ